MVEANSQTSYDENTKPIQNKKQNNLLRKNLLLLSTLAGVVVGVSIGLIFRTQNLSDATIMLISYPGELFLRMLKLVTLPMLISSLVTVSANLNARMNGKIVFRTIIYFACTSMLSAICGICIAMFFQPGNVSVSNAVTQTGHKTQLIAMDSILDLGR